MQPPEENAPRSLKLTIVSVALLALLAVVAFASRSGLGHESQAQPTPRYVSYAFTLFLIVFVLAIPVAAYGFLIQAREGKVGPQELQVARHLELRDDDLLRLSGVHASST